MKFLAGAAKPAVFFESVKSVYSGPEQKVWELTMGEEIDIGAADSTIELAQKAGVGPGLKGIDLNCNNGGGMRCLVRLCGVDSMTGVDITKSVVETGKKRTEEEGLGGKITFITANSLENGLPGEAADFVYSKDAWCYMPNKQLIINEAMRLVKPGGKILFTDWIEGEGLSEEEAQKYLSLMTFPCIPKLEEYQQMLEKAGGSVILAEDSGRFSPAMDCYLYKLKSQAVYDAKKLLAWDEQEYAKLISDFEFMAKLAREGKIIQGMFVAVKGQRIEP